MRVVVGDLWTQPAIWRVIPTNLTGVMGRGVARQARDRYPGLESAYKSACTRGEGAVWTFPEMKFGVVCLAVKRHWRDRADITMISSGLESLRHITAPTVLPLLGCGFGELDPLPVLVQIAASLTTDNFVLVLPDANVVQTYPESFVPGSRRDRFADSVSGVD